MVRSKSLAVFTVVSSIFALQACSEGITSAEEAISNLSSEASIEATDTPSISIGAANPTDTESSIPVTPNVISNYIVNNITILPVTPSSSPDKDSEPDSTTDTDNEAVTDTPDVEPEIVIDPPPETDPELVTDPPPDSEPEVVSDPPPTTDPEVVSDPPPTTDPEVVADPPPTTDPEVVADPPPPTDPEVVATVDYTPALDAPVNGELVPYGSSINFSWSLPVPLFEAVTGFEITLTEASTGLVVYRNNIVSLFNCRYKGLCTYEINGADLPIPEGVNIWAVSSTGDDVSFNIAEATFTLDENPDPKVVTGLSVLSPAAGYIADSSSVDFSWENPSNSNAVYDLHVYSDAARTQKVTGTNGVIFDTRGISTATSHTFTDDPSDGAKRYGLLWQWDDSAYDPATRQEILFEYTAHSKIDRNSILPDYSADYDTVKAMVDSEWTNAYDWFTMQTMTSTDGYFASPILHAAAMMSRTTGDRSYLDVGIRIGQSYIQSGIDMNSDGALDWWSDDGAAVAINKDHHEFRAAMGLASVLIELKRTGYTNGNPEIVAEWREFLKTHVWEKWAAGHTQGDHLGRYKSNTSTKLSWFVGRVATIAMALDLTHETPGNNEYYAWLNNSSSPFGLLFDTYITMIGNRDWDFPYWTNDARSIVADTSNINDAIYPILLGKQLGYDFVGRVDEFLDTLQTHLNYNWFETSDGFRGYANGTGTINQTSLASTNGLALVAALSPSLKARYLEMVLEHEPTNGFYASTTHNPYNAVWQGSGLLWALNGGTL